MIIQSPLVKSHFLGRPYTFLGGNFSKDGRGKDGGTDKDIKKELKNSNICKICNSNVSTAARITDTWNG